MSVEQLYKRLHQIPELAFEEFETSKLIQQELCKIGIPFKVICGTGVVGLIDVGKDKTILLRADIDALPIKEKTELEYSSKNDNMHACGHDAHVAMLLAASKEIFSNKSKLNCNVKFIFQPGEERAGGASKLVNEGVLENPRVDACFAMHVWPSLAAGTLGLKNGVLTALGTRFTIEISAPGGHIAEVKPNKNPIYVASKILTEVEKLWRKDARIHISKIKSGIGSGNIIDTKCVMTGEARVLCASDADNFITTLRNICVKVGNETGLVVKFDFQIAKEYPSVVNNKGMNELINQITLPYMAIKWIENPSFGCEDFSNYAQNGAVSSFVLLGCTPSEYIGTNAIHTPIFKLDLSALSLGAKIFTDVALNYSG
ncbi:MAG: M20 family metallopeptidase [Firmicutes bacterium]|nr:M20 family metallopeptidase [Bacillota bacterium]